MPAANQPSVSRSSFQLSWPSEKTVMAILLTIFFALHVLASVILPGRTQSDATPAQGEETMSLYD
jgi:hypothetical protein